MPTNAPPLGNISPRARAVRNVRQWIAQGDFADGAELPSERVLSEQLGLARGTVRSALDELEHEGLISAADGRPRRVHRGGGLMAATVVILTEAESIVAPERVPMGQDAYIQLAMQAALAGAGRHALTMNPSRLLGDAVRSVIDGRPFGVVGTYTVGAETTGRALLARLAAAKLPVVVHGDAPELKAFDHVTSDQEQGAYDLTRWLIARGKRRILCFWRFPSQRAWIDDRYAGHVRAMREAKLRPLPALRTPELPATSDDEAGFRQTAGTLAGFLLEPLTGKAALRQPIDAIMTATDGHAYQTAGACRRLGRIPGRDLLITGYDHLGDGCVESRYEPGALAATVDKDNRRQAGELVALLGERAAGRLPRHPQRRVVPHRLIVNACAPQRPEARRTP